MTPRNSLIRQANLRRAAALAAGGGLLLYGWSQAPGDGPRRAFPVARTATQAAGIASLVIGLYALGLGYGVLPGA